MNIAIDTQLELKQRHLAILIAALGKETKLLEAWEDENILPLVQAKDRRAFLAKHTRDYKVRLHKLLQKCFWDLPNWKSPGLPATDWQQTELANLTDALSQDLSKPEKTTR